MNNNHSHPGRYHLIVIFEDETKQEVLRGTIEEIDKYTMHYSNGNLLVTELIQKDLIKDKNIDKIIINYAADNQTKETAVLYNNDKSKVNLEYVNRKIHYYSSDLPFLKNYVAKYAKKEKDNGLKNRALNLYIYTMLKEKNIIVTDQDINEVRNNLLFEDPITNEKFNFIKQLLSDNKIDLTNWQLEHKLFLLNSREFNKHNELEEILKILLYNNYRKIRDNYLIVKNYEIIMGFKEDDTNYDLIYKKPIPFNNEEDVLHEIEINKENSLENYYKLPKEKEIEFNKEDTLEDEEIEELNLIKEEEPKQKVKTLQVPNQISFYN